MKRNHNNHPPGLLILAVLLAALALAALSRL
jgi:hypothetical protein